MNALSPITNALKQNAPTLLTAMGIGGVFTTAILAARGGMQAQAHLGEQPAGLTPREKFAETWQFYIPAGIVALTTAGCILGAHTVHTRRQAALFSLYTITETARNEFREQAEALLSPKQFEELQTSASEAHVNQFPPTQEFILADPEKQLFLETMTGRYFNSSVELLRQAAIDMNEQIVNSDYILLNDWYERIGLDRVQIGDETGWNHKKKIELEFDAVPFKQADQVTKPIMVVRYRYNPVPQPYAVW